MRAQHAARVAAGRSSLAPERRTERHQPDRKISVVEHLAAEQRCQRRFGRRDTPEVITLDRVRIVGELRQLPCGGKGRCSHQRRRTDLFVDVSVAVKTKLGERTRHGRTGTALHREHRARYLRRAFVVEDAERLGRFPMGHALPVGERVVQPDGPGNDRVISVGRTIGGIGVRDVRHAKQQFIQKD